MVQQEDKPLGTSYILVFNFTNEYKRIRKIVDRSHNCLVHEEGVARRNRKS